MNKINQQIDHNFMNLTKLVSPFFVNNTNLYGIYKFALETKLENVYKRKRAGSTNLAQQLNMGTAVHELRRPSAAQVQGARARLALCKRGLALLEFQTLQRGTVSPD